MICGWETDAADAQDPAARRLLSHPGFFNLSWPMVDFFNCATKSEIAKLNVYRGFIERGRCKMEWPSRINASSGPLLSFRTRASRGAAAMVGFRLLREAQKRFLMTKPFELPRSKTRLCCSVAGGSLRMEPGGETGGSWKQWGSVG